MKARPTSTEQGGRNGSRFLKTLIRDKWLYLMLFPGVFYFLLFKYGPMYGLIIAFQNFQPVLGVSGSEFVGFRHFTRLFTEPMFWTLFRNTLILAVYNIVFFFPAPILLALLLNEVRMKFFKNTVQMLIYIPHFISWPVVVGLCYVLFTINGGIVNEIIIGLGGNELNVLMNESAFRPMIVAQQIWKEVGWGTIIFLAALAGVNVELYESARMDGASRWRQMYHITLPAIRSTIIILFILRLGSFMDSGFEQIFLMVNALNRNVGEVFDTYVYSVGLIGGQFSYSTAVGLFKSIIGLLLVVAANRLAKLWDEEGVY
ncbi:sugar ABC transporter permease [Paenibacillus sp. IB182496]|uniref:Sugar ABC transporter permease n=1 Tax=Paenibacillus sabuli TaxID=2772509 RepID=A0A927GR39_9BACL|nr:ABC transporter permease subunit [Paenibacillus sabuli]MBD2845043.1 sugar ABC transporter permease [Paenibacillus sabuli]